MQLSINKNHFPDNALFFFTKKWIEISFIPVTWGVTGNTCVRFSLKHVYGQVLIVLSHVKVVVSDQPPLLQQLAVTRALYQIFHFFTKWGLTGHQNTSNHLISHKKLSSRNAYHVQTWVQDGETETFMEEIWESCSQICCMTKCILNSNLIHAEGSYPKQEIHTLFLFFLFQAAIYSCLKWVCRQSN